MDRETATQQMKVLKGKAKTARTDGKKDLAKTFSAGAQRIQRKIKAMPKPVKAKPSDTEEE